MNLTHHFNLVQFTMKPGQKNNFVPCSLDNSLENRWLMKKVVLFAEMMRHTAILILEGPDRFAFGTHARYIKATLLKDLLEALLLPCLVCLFRDTSYLVLTLG